MAITCYVTLPRLQCKEVSSVSTYFGLRCAIPLLESRKHHASTVVNFILHCFDATLCKLARSQNEGAPELALRTEASRNSMRGTKKPGFATIMTTGTLVESLGALAELRCFMWFWPTPIAGAQAVAGQTDRSQGCTSTRARWAEAFRKSGGLG